MNRGRWRPSSSLGGWTGESGPPGQDLGMVVPVSTARNIRKVVHVKALFSRLIVRPHCFFSRWTKVPRFVQWSALVLVTSCILHHSVLLVVTLNKKYHCFHFWIHRCQVICFLAPWLTGHPFESDRETGFNGGLACLQYLAPFFPCLRARSGLFAVVCIITFTEAPVVQELDPLNVLNGTAFPVDIRSTSKITHEGSASKRFRLQDDPCHAAENRS